MSASNMAKPVQALVLDHDALHILGPAIVEPSWFVDFNWPSGEGLRRVRRGNVVYLLSSKADFDSKLLVISVGTNGVLKSDHHPQQILDRIIHVALATVERNVSVPVTWYPYNIGSLYSVYAFRQAKNMPERIYFDRRADGEDNIYAYALNSSKDFSQNPPDLEKLRHAIAGYAEALITDPVSEVADAGAYGVVLTKFDGSSIVGSASLSEWYNKKLTREQRNFVDRSYSEPVRLRGAAGTGKTLSMSIKFLRDILKAEADGRPLSFAFITHSASIAHDTIPAILDALDPDGRWRNLKTARVWIGSVYELAQSLLGYEQKGLRPLSVDGREGREFQAIIISEAIAELKSDTRFMLRDFPKCSANFQSQFKVAVSDSNFTLELMNEIACVIDAENVRLGNSASQRYLSERRERWQMSLENEGDRKAVLEIHDVYRKTLENSEVLSMDQMIADLNRYMQSHEWSRLRMREGFDAIFVDELHYFNRAERMAFHNLFNPSANEGGQMPLFMSYDLKQSPADSFLGGGGSESARTFFQRLKAGESQLVELTEVFRSTPEITRFLRDVDAAFPALDLEAEWAIYTGSSNQKSGTKPILREYERNTDLLDDVFDRAVKDAGELSGKNVAVLCMDEELYNRYLKVGRIEGKFVELSGRDQVGDLKYVGKGRCVFSMPEYVAGLQFKSVYLIHLDRGGVDGGEGSIGVRRRFVSRCYLGASRASEKLEIAVCRERGGRSDVLDIPIERGSITVA